jgi:hypothetical protein
VGVEKDSNGSVLDVGRKSRTVPGALRRALEARDRGGWKIFSDTEGRAVFNTPGGRAVAAAPPLPATDTDALLRGNRERGVAPDWLTGMPPADAA